MANYGSALAANIRAARARLGIGQEEVATRMRTLGYEAWIRQTVSATEQGRRRPLAEEMIGLAMALNTTVVRIAVPVDVAKVEFGEISLTPDEVAVAISGS